MKGIEMMMTDAMCLLPVLCGCMNNKEIPNQSAPAATATGVYETREIHVDRNGMDIYGVAHIPAGVDGKMPAVILSHELGGVVTTMTAAEHRDEIRAVVLVYPAFCIYDDVHEMFDSPEEIPETHRLLGMLLGQRYFLDTWDQEPYALIQEYGKDILLIHGSRDSIVPLSYSDKLAENVEDAEAYKSMEQAVSEGKLRSIGLSNYYTPEDFDRLVSATTITPALLQNETHPYHQSEDMKAHLARYGTVMESWFPLGGRGNTQVLFDDETISAIAAAHGKTSAQVILRWHLQAGNIAIPGSSNEAHIQENFEIFDFALSEEEMAQMTALDQNRRFASY